MRLPATEREYVLAMLAARYVEQIDPMTDVHAIASWVKERVGLTHEGYALFTELAPRLDDPSFRGPDGKVRPEFLIYPYHVTFDADARGARVGGGGHRRPPDITWREIAVAIMASETPAYPVCTPLQLSFLDQLMGVTV